MPVKKEFFCKVIFIATQGLSMHKDKLYQQIDGVTMGSLLGPTLANLFLGCLEENIFKNISNSDVLPEIYLRYIDDVYVQFENENVSLNFFNLLNSQHKAIKFTLEKATPTKSLNFLDVQIQLNTYGYDTCMNRKPSNSGMLLNFNATCPTTWKSGLISCLLCRAKCICSSYNLYMQELKKLRIIF